MAGYNPYHVLGVYANSTEREILKNIGKVKAYQKIGKQPKFDVDFPFLPKLQRTEEIMRQAYSEINTARKKSFYALLWFIKISNLDEQAFKALKQGQIEPAAALWQENLSDISSLWNLSTLYTLNSKQIDGFKLALKLKYQLLHSPSVKTFMINQKFDFQPNLPTQVMKEIVQIINTHIGQEHWKQLLTELPELANKIQVLIYEDVIKKLRAKLNNLKTELENDFSAQMFKDLQSFHNELMDFSRNLGEEVQSSQFLYFFEEVSEIYTEFSEKYLKYVKEKLPDSHNLKELSELLIQIVDKLDKNSLNYKRIKDSLDEIQKLLNTYKDYQILLTHKDLYTDIIQKLEELSKIVSEAQILSEKSINEIVEIDTDKILNSVLRLKRIIKRLQVKIGSENYYYKNIINQFGYVSLAGLSIYLQLTGGYYSPGFKIFMNIVRFIYKQTSDEDLKEKTKEIIDYVKKQKREETKRGISAFLFVIVTNILILFLFSLLFSLLAKHC